MSQTAFGQADPVCLTADKWHLLDALTEAAELIGLNHRTLTVLRALLTFHPERALSAEVGAAVVFPSNATLCKRLNGIPESTLRRHLAALVKAGVIARMDSPNRKRFCRRGGLAFGFDLSPLARAADGLLQAAETARQEQQRRAVLRDRLALARDRALRMGCPVEHLETARLTLRRKATSDVLQSVLSDVERLLRPEDVRPAPTEKMSASDGGNERHIQDTDKKTFVSESQVREGLRGVSLGEVMDHCREYESYFPEVPKTWPGLIEIANRLQAMLGIDRHVYNHALERLGPERTAATVVSILERIGQIRKPGAYLRVLVDRADAGQFNLRGLVTGSSAARLSADNLA